MTSKDTVPFGVTAASRQKQKLPLRRWRAAAIASTAALLLGVSGVAVRAADPIKIGILLPLSGNFAENGQQTLTGMKMYFDEVGNKAGGHDLQLIVEDTQGKPDAAVTKARKLVERDGAQCLPASSPPARRSPSTTIRATARCRWCCPATPASTSSPCPARCKIRIWSAPRRMAARSRPRRPTGPIRRAGARS